MKRIDRFWTARGATQSTMTWRRALALPRDGARRRVPPAPGAWWLVLAGCWLLASCSGQPAATSPQSGKPEAAGQAASASSLKTYSVETLTIPIGQYMPPLEGGKLEIAAPSGWTWQRPGKGFLVGFCPESASLNDLPRILVSTDPTPPEGMADADEANIKELVAHIERTVSQKTLKEPAEPVRVGQRVFVRYVDYAKKGNAVVARLFLTTVAGGHAYTIRLDAYAAQFARYEHAAYAVAASMKFSAKPASDASQ